MAAPTANILSGIRNKETSIIVEIVVCNLETINVTSVCNEAAYHSTKPTMEFKALDFQSTVASQITPSEGAEPSETCCLLFSSNQVYSSLN